MKVLKLLQMSSKNQGVSKECASGAEPYFADFQNIRKTLTEQYCTNNYWAFVSFNF